MNKRSSNNGVSRSIGVSAVVLDQYFTGSPWVFVSPDARCNARDDG